LLARPELLLRPHLSAISAHTRRGLHAHQREEGFSAAAIHPSFACENRDVFAIVPGGGAFALLARTENEKCTAGVVHAESQRRGRIVRKRPATDDGRRFEKVEMDGETTCPNPPDAHFVFFAKPRWRAGISQGMEPSRGRSGYKRACTLLNRLKNWRARRAGQSFSTLLVGMYGVAGNRVDRQARRGR